MLYRHPSVSSEAMVRPQALLGLVLRWGARRTLGFFQIVSSITYERCLCAFPFLLPAFSFTEQYGVDVAVTTYFSGVDLLVMLYR